MSELAVTLLRLSYLALLWVFVFAAISVLRQDLFSATRVTQRGRGARADSTRARRTPAPPAAPSTPAPPPRPAGTAPQRQSITRPPSRLMVTAGKLAGTSLPLGKSAIVVGRAPSCTLVLEDDYASSRHARFFPQGDSWMIEDLGSTNGTTVAGRTISEPTPLAPGTEVRIGQTALELRR